jgi:hypothetical protein
MELIAQRHLANEIASVAYKLRVDALAALNPKIGSW